MTLGHLEVGDGNRVYWESLWQPGREASGGGAWRAGERLHSDASAVLRSRPTTGLCCSTSEAQAGAPHTRATFDTSLEPNSTDHLVRDMEALRSHLSIDQWLVFGNSWGSTLGLVYGQRHPERVSECVLLAVTTTDREEIRWLYHGAGRLFPEAWERFHESAGVSRRDDDLVGAYYRLLNSPDLAVREMAAAEWCRWEDAVVSGGEPNPRYDDPRFQMAFARIVTHYFHHGAWLEPRQIVRIMPTDCTEFRQY